MIDLQNYEYNFALCRSVRLFLQLFVGGRMSYLRDLYLFANSGVQHILLFALFVFVLCALCCQYLWIGPSIFSNLNGNNIGRYGEMYTCI
jgi:hypothetical protein